MYLVVSAVVLVCVCALSCLSLLMLSRRQKRFQPSSSADAGQGSSKTAAGPQDPATAQDPDFDVLESTEDQKRFSAHWEGVLKKFNDYTRAKYPTDARFANARSKWTGKISFYKAKTDTYKNAVALYSSSDGVIYVNTDMVKNPAKTVGSAPNDYPATTFLMLHELAHTSGTSHDETWRDAFVAFLKVARDELKWGCSDQCARLLTKYA